MAATVDVVFHVAFAAGEPFRLPQPQEPGLWGRLRGAEVIAPRPRNEPKAWKLPLYPYSDKLDSNVRSWLPHCLLDWKEKADAHADLDGPEGAQFGESNVSLWEPDLVLVTQPAKLAGDVKHRSLDAANRKVMRVSTWLSGTKEAGSPLAPLLGRAFGGSDDSIAAQLKRDEFDPHPLWAFVLLMGIQNVVWHAAIQYDGKLVEHIAAMHPGPDEHHRRLRRERPLDQVERQGDALLSVSFDVAHLHGSVASLRTHLEQGNVQSYWDYMDRTWGLSGYIDSIARKAADLVALHDRVVTQRTSRRARRLANAAMFFTGL